MAAAASTTKLTLSVVYYNWDRRTWSGKMQVDADVKMKTLLDCIQANGYSTNGMIAFGCDTVEVDGKVCACCGDDDKTTVGQWCKDGSKLVARANIIACNNSSKPKAAAVPQAVVVTATADASVPPLQKTPSDELLQELA
jgi:hypothetical protein